MADVLVVGAGFAGAVCAECLASVGRKVLVIDKRDHIGGNCYDEIDSCGVRVGKYGAHIFHTNSGEVYRYLSRFTEWRPYTHRVLSRTRRGLVPVPINRRTLEAFGGDLAAAQREMIEPYTRKQWGEWADELSPTVLARIKMRDSDEDRYFLDKHQGMPADGYTRLFERMLDHPNITVELKSRAERRTDKYETVIWTGPLDQACGYLYGTLPYRSARFEWVLSEWMSQPVAVINEPSLEVPWTRSIEFAHFYDARKYWTRVAKEIPQADGDPYWPVLTPVSLEARRKYLEVAREFGPGFYVCGRLGTFQYLNMDQVVAQALKLSATILQEERVMVNGYQEDGAAMNDGMERYSPVPATGELEAPQLLSFPSAIQMLLNGYRITRMEWGNPAVTVFILGGLLKLQKADRSIHDLIVSDNDLRATDWVTAA